MRLTAQGRTARGYKLTPLGAQNMVKKVSTKMVRNWKGCAGLAIGPKLPPPPPPVQAQWVRKLGVARAPVRSLRRASRVVSCAGNGGATQAEGGGRRGGAGSGETPRQL